MSSSASYRDLVAQLRLSSAAAEAINADQKDTTASSDESIYPAHLFLTDPEVGLSDAEASSRQSTYGLNRFSEASENLWLKFFGYFIGPVQFVMILGAILAAGLQLWIDLGVICGLLLLNALVGFLQEYQAGNVVDKLKREMEERSAIVLRDGKLIELSVELVTIGDILYLEEGLILPADGRLIEDRVQRDSGEESISNRQSGLKIDPKRAPQTTASSMPPPTRQSSHHSMKNSRLNISSYSPTISVDQSMLTGESLPVEKSINDTIYGSSIVKHGTGLLMVTAIGDQTFIGKTASLIQSTENRGHFAIVLSRISYILLILVSIFLLIQWIGGLFYGRDMRYLLTDTFILIVIGVPVGLPAVVTTTMAVGAAELAKRRAIVRKLSAIESLAGVDILCTDKTGTLTLNELSIEQVFYCGGPALNSQLDSLFRACSLVEDDASSSNISPYDAQPESWWILGLAALASSRYLQATGPINKAILLAAQPGLLKCLDEDFEVVQFYPFDPVTKRSACKLKHLSSGTLFTCTKGAPNAIAALMGSSPSDELVQFNAKVQEFADRGFRALGVAIQFHDLTNPEESMPWRLVGLLALFDPPRPDTIPTILEAQKLGLVIKMLTGDALGIAKETCLRLNLGNSVYDTRMLIEAIKRDPKYANLLSVKGDTDKSSQHQKKYGEPIDSASAVNVFELVESADGFAEVFPDHKYVVVDLLQRKGHLVAMTGDGVNDAPSLKKADTGIAVHGATQAAQISADIVLLSPGLSTIIHALITSRQIFQRMRAYVIYRIALSLHLEIFLTTVLLVLNVQLNSALVVFLAIFADLATLAIAYDHAFYSSSPTKWKLKQLWLQSVVLGTLLAIFSWVLVGVLLVPTPNIVTYPGVLSPPAVQSILFLQIALTQNWLIFVTRSTLPIRKNLPSLQLVAAVLLVDVLATLFTLFGWFTGTPVDILTVCKVWIYSILTWILLYVAFLMMTRIALFLEPPPDNDLQAANKANCKKSAKQKKAATPGTPMHEPKKIIRSTTLDIP